MTRRPASPADAAMPPAPSRRATHDGRRSRSATSMVGGGAPIVVQSMTNTDTADIDGTVAQVAALARAGSELVRITVDRDEAAAAVPHIRERLDARRRRRAAGRRLPLYRPQAAGRPSGLRRGARQIPHQSRQCRLQGQEGPPVRRRSSRLAIKHGKAVRIGANWGSLDQELLTAPDGRERRVAPRRSTRAP